MLLKATIKEEEYLYTISVLLLINVRFGINMMENSTYKVYTIR